MNISATSFRPVALDSFGGNLAMASFISKPDAAFDEGQFNFTTIDGNMMPYNAGTNAVSSGAGIFIGDYFVGISDDSMFSGNSMPCIKY